MKIITRRFLSFLILAAVLLVSCGPGETGQETKIPATKPAVAAEATWEKEWGNVLAEAKKEGTVSLYTIFWPSPTRAALSQALKDKFGINLEHSPYMGGAQLVAKVKEEQRAGLNIADVFGVGGGTLIASMKPESLLSSLEPLLILPEVVDPRRWTGEKIPFIDKDKQGIGMLANSDRSIVVNTDLVKRGEITTFKDLLKPQYKGKITMGDPSVSGAGNAIMTHLAINVWNLEEAKEFLRQLARQQEVVIQRDPRLLVESVARGKYPIGVGASTQFIVDLINAKAPIDIAVVKEATLVTHSAGILAVPLKFAHPNAARFFVNWLLSKEGQTIFTQSWGQPSLRTDVSTEGFSPVILPQPGEKLFIADENTYFSQGQMINVNKEIIEQTLR